MNRRSMRRSAWWKAPSAPDSTGRRVRPAPAARRPARPTRCPMLRATLAFVLLVTVSAEAQAPRSDRFDVLIQGGRVLDGTGNPWFYADIGIRGGPHRGDRAAQRDVTRRASSRPRAASWRPDSSTFTPTPMTGRRPRGGFRDPDAARRAAPNLVTQGVTTVVVNQDGRSPLPIGDQRDLHREERDRPQRDAPRGPRQRARARDGLRLPPRRERRRS